MEKQKLYKRWQLQDWLNMAVTMILVVCLGVGGGLFYARLQRLESAVAARDNCRCDKITVEHQVGKEPNSHVADGVIRKRVKRGNEDDFDKIYKALLKSQKKQLLEICGNSSKVCTPGLKGERGAEGVHGRSGTKGDVGSEGNIGEKGNNGVTGKKGQNGAVGFGIPGPRGDIGKIGYNGTRGVIGSKGDQGYAGIQGAIGPQGIPGQDGKAGNSGVQGAQGGKGDNGKKGENGAVGATGKDGKPGFNGTHSVKVIKGDKGDIGQIGLKGSTGPTGQMGKIGLKGARGIKGNEGNYSIIDVTGLAGAKGEPGSHGINGSIGIKGSKGDQGNVTNVKGQKGDPGIAGLKGLKGSKGYIGSKGEKGIPGKPGTSVKSCPLNWKNHGVKCYRFSKCTKACSPNDARDLCKGFGGALTSVRSDEDNIFISSLAGDSFSKIATVILGGTDEWIENRWQWQDGSVARYFNWFKGEPNNCCGGQDCMVMWRQKNNKWDDTSCTSNHSISNTGYVCERKM